MAPTAARVGSSFAASVWDVLARLPRPLRLGAAFETGSSAGSTCSVLGSIADSNASSRTGSSRGSIIGSRTGCTAAVSSNSTTTGSGTFCTTGAALLELDFPAGLRFFLEGISNSSDMEGAALTMGTDNSTAALPEVLETAFAAVLGILLSVGFCTVFSMVFCTARGDSSSLEGVFFFDTTFFCSVFSSAAFTGAARTGAGRTATTSDC